MTQPLLSICIPNYNRADFLAKNLTAIGSQAQGNVEIVVSDNASTENIKGVIQNFQAKFPRVKIRLNRNRTNIGFDRNVIKVVGQARGQYCWLLSNDDQILPGSVAKITNLIRKKKPAFILINYRRFDYHIKKITSSRMVNLRKDLTFNDGDAFYFFPTPTSYFVILGINTLTMSCDIFNRRYWLESIARTKKFADHNFIHVFTILDLIRHHPSIYFLAQPQVQYVSNNHRPWANYIWRDYRHVLLPYLAKIGYDPNQLKTLKARLKQDELNERLWATGQRSGLYQRFFPYIRKIRHLLGHHI